MRLTTALFGAEATLFHAGVIDAPPRKTHPDKSAARAAAWAAVAPRLAATLLGYIEQMRLSLRAATIVSLEGALREFAGWLVREAPEVSAVALLRRSHIENYKLHLAGPASARGGRLSKTALAEHIGVLRTCFERLTEWAGDDIPAAVLVFAGDLPIGATTHCRVSSTTRRRPSCSKPPAPTPTRSPASRWSSSPAPGCARANSSI